MDSRRNQRQALQGSDVLSTLLRRFWVLALGLILGGVLGGLISFLMTPIYQANANLLVVTASPSIENSAPLDYARAYSELPTNPGVVEAVVREYGIAPDAQDIQEVVSVEAPANSPTFRITTRSQSPGEATALANDLASAVSSFTTDDLAPGTGYRAVVVAEASTPGRPTTPDWTLNIAVGAASGLMIGGIAALFWDDLRQAKKKRERAV